MVLGGMFVEVVEVLLVGEQLVDVLEHDVLVVHALVELEEVLLVDVRVVE